MQSRQDNADPAVSTGSRAQRADAAARAKLSPLGPGERPRAITVASLAALALAALNLCAFALGARIGAARPPTAGVVSYSVVMLMAGIGLWRTRYWAAVTMQAMLVVLICLFSILAFTAQNLKSLVLALCVIAACGTLFWFLIRAMARIQLTERTRRAGEDQPAAGADNPVQATGRDEAST